MFLTRFDERLPCSKNNVFRQIKTLRSNKIIGSLEDFVLNIALTVGFNSSSSFYKAFKKEIGKTPRRFRSANCASNFGSAAIGVLKMLQRCTYVRFDGLHCSI